MSKEVLFSYHIYERGTMANWKEKMDARYGKNTEQELPYWDGTMLPERKEELAARGYEFIDCSLALLWVKGYRVVKSSAFTPKGIYDRDHVEPVEGKPAADNLFFEQNFDPVEFMSIYNKYGRYENNFPVYFDGTAESYSAYAQKSDIFVLEEIATNKPVGFASFQLINAGTSEAKEMEAEGIFVKNKLVYNDTIAISSALQGKGLGKIFSDVLDAYYVQNFGVDADYALCTGAINTNDHNDLAKGFHGDKRGYGNWVENTGLLKKWIARWKQDNIEKKGPNIKPAFMKNSYLNPPRRG